MITAQKSHTLTWETESASAGTMEVLEIVCIEAGDDCSKGAEGHETYDSNGDIIVCVEVSGNENEEDDKKVWKWQKKG